MPFVPVNCGSITDGVPEEEIVSHVTALMKKVDGGSIYLDEIAELSSGLRLTILQAIGAEKKGQRTERLHHGGHRKRAQGT